MEKTPQIALIGVLGFTILSCARTDAATLSGTSGTGGWDDSIFATFTPDFGSAESDIRSSRQHRQSFTLTSSVTVSTILLGGEFIGNTGAATWTMAFFDLGTTSTATTDYDAGGTQVGSIININATQAPGGLTGDGVLRIDLSPTEQLTLAAGNYYLAIDAGATGTTWFKWDVGGTGSVAEKYAGGHAIISGSDVSSGDFAFAVVPEPSAYGLFSCGIALLAFRRRRKTQ